jgi:signal transduction histidine kinase
MITGATRFGQRLVGMQIASTLFAAVASTSTPFLLLLDGDQAFASIRLLWQGIFAGGLAAVARSLLLWRHHRYLLRSLALGSTAIDAERLSKLSTEGGRSTLVWLAATMAGVLVSAVVARPAFLDRATSTSAALVGLVIAAATTLPLYVGVRRAVMRTLENAAPEVARELVVPRLARVLASRIERRLVIALVAPVVFFTVASTLVVTAHLRRADSQQRDATALAMARAAFESVPGPLPYAGVEEATRAARRLGFFPEYSSTPQQYARTQLADGSLELTAPLDEGSVAVRFEPATFHPLNPIAWWIATITIATAAYVGWRLGVMLTRDIEAALRGVRALDTDTILEGGLHVVGRTRFQVVTDLGSAIEHLADRFRIFAQAQERAIRLREATTRMRGLFFASVSHDLKTPLNAILGFAAVVRQGEELTEGQDESLAVIERSGRELLALIEMILDAARVEARQLQLVREPVTVGSLMQDIIEKGRHLAGDNPVEVVGDIADGIGILEVDRVRLSSALATFVGHAGRTVPGAMVRLQIVPLENGWVGFALEMPVPTAAPPTKSHHGGALAGAQRGVHRGLALGMGLSRSIIELHGGSVTLQERADKQRFVVRIPIGPSPTTLPPTPLYSTPLPPRTLPDA